MAELYSKADCRPAYLIKVIDMQEFCANCQKPLRKGEDTKSEASREVNRRSSPRNVPFVLAHSLGGRIGEGLLGRGGHPIHIKSKLLL